MSLHGVQEIVSLSLSAADAGSVPSARRGSRISATTTSSPALPVGVPSRDLSSSGCGGGGLSAILIASAVGARVIAVDISAEKVELARSFGASEGVNAKATPHVAREIHRICGGAHLSVDAVGHPRISRNSVKSLRKRGRHIQIGLTIAEERSVSVPMDMVIAWELELLGSHGIQSHRYADMLTWVKEQKIDLKRLVHRTVSLEESIDVLVNMDSFTGLGVTVIDEF